MAGKTTAASYTLDLAGRRREYMRVTVDLGDGVRELAVMEPRKRLTAKLDALYASAGEGDGLLDRLYDAVAAVLSNNSQGVEVTAEQAAEALSVGECWAVANSYRRFTAEQIKLLAKN